MTDAELLAARSPPPDDDAGHVGAVHAQPQAQAPPPSDRPPHIGHPRRERRDHLGGLCRRLCRPYPGREARNHRCRRATPRISSSRSVLSKPCCGSQPREPRTIMKIWHFSETAYPYLPPASEYESVRVDLPEPLLRPRKRRSPVRPLHRRMAGGGRRGHPDHAQRASSDPDMRRPGRTSLADRAGAGDQKSAAPDPRQSRSPIAASRCASPRKWRSPTFSHTAASRSDSCAACHTRYRPQTPTRSTPTNAIGRRSTSSSRHGRRTTGRSATRAAFSMRGASTSGRGRTSSPTRRCGSVIDQPRRRGPRRCARLHPGDLSHRLPRDQADLRGLSPRVA